MQSHQISICSWSLRPRNPEMLVSDLQKCAITRVQLALVPLAEDESWSHCKQMLLDAGITIVSGMFEPAGEDYTSLETIAKTGGVRQDATWFETLGRVKASAGIASDLGLSLVTFHAGFLPHAVSEERTKMLDRLVQIADIFASNKIAIAFETGQESAEVLLGVLEEMSHPNIGVNFDPANMILYGQGDPVTAINQLTPWVRQVHIKDAIATEVEGTWGTEVVVGNGDVVWDAFIPVIPSGVNLVIEREAGENRVKDIQRAITFLKGKGC
ncbi:MAG: sugar phosphate isomerase/epimerase [Planctomycetes bacterium]|nr:sugar phosphate isomerase/epimerase [Planctomycetota bacterium]